MKALQVQACVFIWHASIIDTSKVISCFISDKKRLSLDFINAHSQWQIVAAHMQSFLFSLSFSICWRWHWRCKWNFAFTLCVFDFNSFAISFTSTSHLTHFMFVAGCVCSSLQVLPNVFTYESSIRIQACNCNLRYFVVVVFLTQ